MTRRAFTAIASLRVVANASSAQEWISLTLINICKMEALHIEDADQAAPFPTLSCCESWVLMAYQFPSGRSAVHFTQKCL